MLHRSCVTNLSGLSTYGFDGQGNGGRHSSASDSFSRFLALAYINLYVCMYVSMYVFRLHSCKEYDTFYMLTYFCCPDSAIGQLCVSVCSNLWPRYDRHFVGITWHNGIDIRHGSSPRPILGQIGRLRSWVRVRCYKRGKC